MKTAVFSTKPYDRKFLDQANAANITHTDSQSAAAPGHQFTYIEARLSPETAPLAAGHDAVCVFVNDKLDATVLKQLAGHGVRVIALRCAGFNNVDLAAAEALGLTVVRVPAYSPHAVAEYTLALMLTINRKIHRAYNRVREGNFAIDGLLGFDMHGRTAGVVGTGRIGAIVAKLLHAFGCNVMAYDVHPDPACLALGIRYVQLPELITKADILTLHCPLTPKTRHMISASALRQMKPGSMLINTSRGGLVDTLALIQGLKTGHIGSAALDVYEEEADVFFEDLSSHAIQDDVLARLMTFPNVLVTSHQAFFTKDAMQKIAQTTLGNLSEFEGTGVTAENRVKG